MKQETKTAIKRTLAGLVVAGTAASIVGYALTGDAIGTPDTAHRSTVTGWQEPLHSDVLRLDAELVDVRYTFHGRSGCRAAISEAVTTVACPDGYLYRTEGTG